MTLLRFGSATDVGKVRANNQDQLLVAEPLFAVADGMGGHAAGEVASLTAVEALRQAFSRDRSRAGLVAAGEQANRAVWDRALDDPTLHGMGTTLVAMALVAVDGEDRLIIINVGDSRLYLLRQGEFEQLTSDHSLVQELVDVGEITEDEAAIHPQRNVLTRALGVDSSVVIDELEILPVKGDRYLLCSDGLPREVSDAQMASILRRLTNPSDVAKELVAEARAHGGNDNITVVVVDVVDDDDRAAAASAALAEDPGLAIPSTIGKSDSDGDDRRPRARFRRSTGRRARAPRSRPITFRVVGFIVVLAALVAGAFAAIGFYARGSYFVGIAAEQLTIYKGRPGGLLWFQPTLVERTDVTTAAVLPSRLGDLQRGQQEATVADARRYVSNLKAEGQTHNIGTTTTTTSTTTTSTVPSTTTTIAATTTTPTPTSTAAP
jgi:serine/threonine protein phosphatase PrpC